ncbi:MAG TPA: CHASE3 domain-containing protein [Bryobacteraceae bacterium]|nr:CHASE3 domain-containing protein [Bryobacteraceae bacterium]
MRIANRAGAALLAGALLVLIVMAAVFRKDAAAYAALDAESNRLHALIDKTQVALSYLKDAETGQRGFLITSKETYLDPYRTGLRLHLDALAVLRRQTAEYPRLSDLFGQLEAVSGKKRQEMASTIDLFRLRGKKAATERVAADRGKQYMDQARQLTDRMVRIEEKEVALRNRQTTQLGASTRRKAFIGAAVLFLFTTVGAVLLGIEIRYERRVAARLERSERRYKKLAENLENQVEARTRDLRQLNDELRAFSYSVSHDLRAPLRSIDGFSQIVLEDYSERLDDTGRDLLRRIRAGATRMGALIQSLLELSRVTRQELRIERVSLSSIADSVIDSLLRAEPGRDVEVVVEPDLEVNADPQLMRVVLDNLLANAWKFTSRMTPARIEFRKNTEVHGDVFFVRDNGSGFDPAQAGRLFTPFQRLHSEAEFEGTGIGLATVQRAIHRHGGRIWAESRPGEGATFFFAIS